MGEAFPRTGHWKRKMFDSRAVKCYTCKKETYQSGLDDDFHELCLDCWYKYIHEKV